MTLLFLLAKYLMKHSFWLKNNHQARPQPNRDLGPNKDTFMLGQRATLYSQHKDQHTTISHNEEELADGKETKFEQLKREIKHLENSQFLSMKYRCATEPDSFEDVQFRMTGKEFMPSKKIATLEKYKMHLRRKGRTRKVSLLLDRTRP
jgi:hypothetical protein